MKCTSPMTVGFLSDGKTLAWSQKNYSKEYPTFQLPCGKCISCRLESAREKAIRCVHEAQMHQHNMFLTLTYSDEHLTSKKLVKKDVDLFIKKLRDKRFRDLLDRIFPNVKNDAQRKLWNRLPKSSRDAHFNTIRISVFGCGEYGEINKRPHWHLIIFNYWPEDAKVLRSTELGHQIHYSEFIDSLWGKNDTDKVRNEIGSVTLESAGYVARYSSKKLVHGKDGEHDYNPVPIRSTGQAIGKKWLECYFTDVFNHGYVEHNGLKLKVPRYYEKWLAKNHPEKWEYYITETKQKIVKEAQEKYENETNEWRQNNLKRSRKKGVQKRLITKSETKNKILKQKFKRLQEMMAKND